MANTECREDAEVADERIKGRARALQQRPWQLQSTGCLLVYEDAQHATYVGTDIAENSRPHCSQQHEGRNLIRHWATSMYKRSPVEWYVVITFGIGTKIVPKDFLRI